MALSHAEALSIFISMPVPAARVIGRWTYYLKYRGELISTSVTIHLQSTHSLTPLCSIVPLRWQSLSQEMPPPTHSDVWLLLR
jgi:hypothetical protein